MPPSTRKGDSSQQASLDSGDRISHTWNTICPFYQMPGKFTFWFEFRAGKGSATRPQFAVWATLLFRPGVQAKFWNPESLCSIPRRCPFFHGLPSLAGDGRQRARPLYFISVHILWPNLMGILTDMFDKHILLICVPQSTGMGVIIQHTPQRDRSN